jgi:hypothetical protein
MNAKQHPEQSTPEEQIREALKAHWHSHRKRTVVLF